MFILGFPIILILLFSFAFGSGTFLSGGSLPHEVVVINEDVGVKVVANNTTKYVNYGDNFIGVLENATSENTTTHLFKLNNASKEKADDLLKSRNIDAVITIPSTFSTAFVTMVNNSTRIAISSSVGEQSIANSSKLSSTIGATANNVNLTPVYDPTSGTYVYVTPTPTATSSVSIPGANVTLPKAGNTSSTLMIQGDSGYVNYATTEGILTALFDRYKDEVRSNATALAVPKAGNMFADYVPLESLPMAGTQSFSLFDYLVPGLIVFAVLLQTSMVASFLARDVESGTLNRLKLSKVRAFDLLFGTFVTWTLVTIMQMVILVAIAILFGYNYQGGFSGLSLALLIGVIAGMASISLALLVAAFAKNEMQAMGLAGMISTPIAFMAGAFMPLPRQEIGTIGDRVYQVYDVLPWTHAVSSLRAVLTYGTGLTENVVVDMWWLIGLTALLFVVGVVAYRQTRLTAEK